MSSLLKLAKLAQADNMAEMDIRSAGIESLLEAQLFPRFEQGYQFRFRDYFDDSPFEKQILFTFI